MNQTALIVDQYGNPMAGTFGQALPTTDIRGQTTGLSAGLAVGGLNPAGKLQAVAIDAYGSLTIRPGVCPTYTATSLAPVATTTAAGRSMLSVFNASSSNWARIAALYAQCPPQVNTQGGLLGIGSGTSYTQIIFGMYRITGHSGGTVLPLVSADPTDDAGLDTAITVRVGATLAGRAANASFAWDAAYSATTVVGPRPDVCMKVWSLPPGTGIAAVNVNAISTSVGFLMTCSLAQNVA